MSHGRERAVVSALFTKTSYNDYTKLCDTDVLEFKESHYKHDNYVHENFKKQLKRDEEAWYETGLVWKEGNLPLNNNKKGSLGRLKSLARNLKRDSEIRKASDTVIKEQVQNKIIEKVSNNEIPNCKEFYLSHKHVTRKKRNLRQIFH